MAVFTHGGVRVGCPTPYADDEVFAHKNRSCAIANVVIFKFGSTHNHKNGVIAIIFNFGALMVGKGVFQGKFVQVKGILNLLDGLKTGVMQPKPNELTVVGQLATDLINAQCGDRLARFTRVGMADDCFIIA